MPIGISPSLSSCSFKCRWLFLPGPAHAACPVLYTQLAKAAHKAHHQLCKIPQDIAILLEDRTISGGSLVAAAFFQSGRGMMNLQVNMF